VRLIEEQEWAHRAIVGRMLSGLGAKPEVLREIMMFSIGSLVGCACFLIGWFMPMYFAGRLETANVKEYETAAEHARALGLTAIASELMELSDTEYEHERFFWSAVTGHPLLPAFRLLFPWTPEKDRSQEITRAADGGMFGAPATHSALSAPPIVPDEKAPNPQLQRPEQP
jgi:hypothetical protein